MRASATVLACLGRAQSEELPHTFPILRTWVRCGVMSRISKEAHRRGFTGFVVSVFRILDRFGPRASATQPKIPSNRRCHPYGWPNAWPLSHSGKDWRRGHGRSPIPFRSKSCARSPGGGSRTSCRLARYSRSERQAMPAKGWAKCAVAPGCRAQSKAACENPIHLRYLVRVNPSGPMKQRKP